MTLTLILKMLILQEMLLSISQVLVKSFVEKLELHQVVLLILIKHQHIPPLKQVQEITLSSQLKSLVLLKINIKNGSKHKTPALKQQPQLQQVVSKMLTNNGNKLIQVC